jgi:membrane-associated phospholipid phosphatase
MRTTYRRWSEHPYQGQNSPPRGSTAAAYWTMFFITRRGNNQFFDPFGQRILWKIKHPNEINWDAELQFVEQTLQSLTQEQIRMAKYWGTGSELTAKITDDIFRLAKTYKVGSARISRILAYVHAALNDIFVLTWFLKYQWDVARPNQYSRNLPKVLSTPLFPSYPSAHATVAGCAEVILSYFFPLHSQSIVKKMEESALSRLYAGVHFKVDNDEGLKLGRQIGEMVVRILRSQEQFTPSRP